MHQDMPQVDDIAVQHLRRLILAKLYAETK